MGTLGAAEEHRRQEAPVDLAPYVPRLVLDWYRERPADRWRTLEGTMVSADISGFTKLSERLAGTGKRGSEELTELLNQCFHGMITTAANYGGDVLKFGGDALLLFYTGAEHAERAATAALEMLRTIKQPLFSPVAGRVALRMSQGVNSGTYTFFLVDAGHHELIVTGPPVTTTVSCESQAEAGQVLLSSEAARRVPAEWLGAAVGDRVLLKQRLRKTSPAPYPAESGSNGVDPALFIPPAQASVIASSADGEHRQATVAFIHFAGTEPLMAAGDFAEVADRLQGLADHVRDATNTFGTHWLSTDVYAAGGKVILSAGAPASLGDDEERMLRTVRAVLDTERALQLRAGVNRGPVFAGNLGSGLRQTYTVMGDAVNLAARLMQKAESGQLIASQRLLDNCRARVIATPIPPFMVKGKSALIAASLVERVEEHQLSATGSSPALVGRTAEMATLEDLLQAALSGQPTAAEITGEVGLGKSRLIAELCTRHPDLRYLPMPCGQYARATPYFAVQRMLNALAGFDPSLGAAEAGVRLQQWVQDVASELIPWLPLIADAFGAEVAETETSADIASSFRRSEIHRSVLRLLEVVLPGPALFHIKDAQWLDDASHELLAYLAMQSPNWMMCATRVGGDPVFPASVDAPVIELAPLEREHVTQLVTALIGDRQVSERDIAALGERSGGNPLFAIELVRTLDGNTRSEDLPESVEALLAARIDTLAGPDRQLLRQAAAIGQTVDLQLLSNLTGDPGVATPERWEALAEFVTTAPRMVSFRHSVLREVAYEGLSYRRRRRVHEDIGRALEALNRGDDDVELLSLHFHRAEDRERAWRYSLSAGDLARKKWANVEAAEFYVRALENASAMAAFPLAEVARVRELLGDVLERAGRYESAGNAYRLARKAHFSPVDTPRLLRKQGVIAERRGRYTQALRWYGRAMRQAPISRESVTGEDSVLNVTLSIDYAGVRYRQGRFAGCVKWAEQAAQESEAVGYSRGLAHSYFLIDLAQTYLRRHEPTWRSHRALVVFERLGDLYYQGAVLNNLGLRAYYAGEWTESAEYHRRSREARERAGDVVGAAASMSNLAEILSDQGHLEEAELLFRRALRAWEVAGYPVGIALAKSNLGRIAQRMGRTQEAHELLEDALGRFTALQAGSFVLETSVRMGECLLTEGESSEALRLAEHVLSTLANDKAEPALEASAHRLVALACVLEGRSADALLAAARSLAAAESSGSRYERALSLTVRASLLRGSSDPAADRDEDEARELFDLLGVRRHPAEAVPSVQERSPSEKVQPIAALSRLS